MNSNNNDEAIELCEQILLEIKSYNIEHAICTSEDIVIDRLLDRKNDLVSVYQYLINHLQGYPYALKLFFEALLATPTIWNCGKQQECRIIKRKLVETNQNIALVAESLTKLLDERENLNNRSSIIDNSDSNLPWLIMRASEGNGFFRRLLLPEIENLSANFDTKYWPKLSECLEIIATDAREHKIESVESITEIATSSNRTSKQDTVLAFFKLLEARKGNNGWIPSNFKLPNKHSATLMNIVLDLRAEELCSDVYIKGVKQKEKIWLEKQKSCDI